VTELGLAARGATIKDTSFSKGDFVSDRAKGQPTKVIRPRTTAFPWRGALLVGGALIALLAWTSLRLVETNASLRWTQAAIALGLGTVLAGLLLVLQQRRQAMRGLDPALSDGRRVYLVPALVALVLLSFVISLLPLPYPLAWVSTLLPVLVLVLAIWLGYRLLRSIPPQPYVRAQRAYQDGRLNDALGELRALQAKQPDYYPALHLQTVIHRRQNDCQAAYAEAEKLIALRPDLYYGFAELGLTLLEDGQPLRACEPLSRATELAPALPEAHLNLGLARLEVEEHRGAIASLGQALRLGLDDPVARIMARYGLLVSFQALGDQEQAAREWRRLRRRRGVLRRWRRELAERPGSSKNRGKEQAFLAAIERGIAQPPVQG
jgi:tetratricopeptide (TPR) repeat protein